MITQKYQKTGKVRFEGIKLKQNSSLIFNPDLTNTIPIIFFLRKPIILVLDGQIQKVASHSDINPPLCKTMKMD